MEKTLRLRDNVEIEVSIRIRQTMNYSPVTLSEYSERLGGSFDLNGIRGEVEGMVDTVSAVIFKSLYNEKEKEEAEQSNG